MDQDRAAHLRALRIECSQDLHFFTRYMFKQRKKFKWSDNWHHRKICAALMRVFRGQTRRLIINIPPRYSKTEIAVINFMAWSLGQVPDAEFIHVSYSGGLAQNNSFAVQMMAQSPEFREIFPRVQINPKVSGKGEWRTTEGGVLYATSSYGPITGFGAGKDRDGFGGCLLIDDPHKADEAKSDVMRGKVLDNYVTTLQSRLNRPKETPVIVIMQRLHENDLSGFLLKGGSGEEWEHLCIPAINENDEALWPEKHTLEALRTMERASPYMFAGQYMQRPAPLGGGIFKDAWWRYWTGWHDRAFWPHYWRIVQSWDTAQKTKEQNDYSVCTTWLQTATDSYLVDIYKAKLEAPDLRRMAMSLAEKYRPHAVLIEDKSSGTGLIQDLRRDTRVPVIGLPKQQDKVQCANEVTPLIEAGKVWLPEGHPETAAYVLSHSQFPNAAHDDDVDSTTQALKWMSRGSEMMTMPLSGA